MTAAISSRVRPSKRDSVITSRCRAGRCAIARSSASRSSLASVRSAGVITQRRGAASVRCTKLRSLAAADLR